MKQLHCYGKNNNGLLTQSNAWIAFRHSLVAIHSDQFNDSLWKIYFMWASAATPYPCLILIFGSIDSHWSSNSICHLNVRIFISSFSNETCNKYMLSLFYNVCFFEKKEKFWFWLMYSYQWQTYEYEKISKCCMLMSFNERCASF